MINQGYQLINCFYLLQKYHRLFNSNSLYSQKLKQNFLFPNQDLLNYFIIF